MISQDFLPKVSCLIINEGKYGLCKTLQSVAIQTYPNLECIIVNSSSTNENISSFNNIIHKSINVNSTDENFLIEKAVNESSGEFIFFIKNNNYFFDENIITQLLSGESYDTDIIYGSMIKIYPDESHVNAIYSNNIDIEQILFDYLDLFPVSLFKKKLFYDYNFFQKDLKYTSKLLFELKTFVFNLLTIKYKDISIIYQNVNRSGQTAKYSDAHLIAKERDKLIEEYLSPSFKLFLYEKIDVVNYFKYSRTMSVVRKLERLKDIALFRLSNILQIIKYALRSLSSSYGLRLYKEKYATESYNIPIIINNRNHLSYLKTLINSLEKRGYKNIYIIDNNSTYEALRSYYNTIPYKVFALEDNVGFCALWDTELYNIFEDNYYVYTDSDLELVDECPKDFLVVMQYFLNEYKVGKVGLSLPINDLPDHFANKYEVIAWEQQFQRHDLEKLVYRAKVDTTFALYGPGKFGHASMLTSLRMKFPYSARHLPWYENTGQLTAEQIYYYTNAKTSSHWSSKIKLNDEKVD